MTFDSKKFQLAGEKLTLNQIEKQKLKPEIDPRVHFVLVCAALSCPVLEAYQFDVPVVCSDSTAISVWDTMEKQLGDGHCTCDVFALFYCIRFDFNI